MGILLQAFHDSQTDKFVLAIIILCLGLIVLAIHLQSKIDELKKENDFFKSKINQLSIRNFNTKISIKMELFLEQAKELRKIQLLEKFKKEQDEKLKK